MDDHEILLIKRIIAGEKSLYEKIIKDHQAMVYRVCLRFMKNVEDAEDLTQEVFITVYKNLHKFNFKSSLATWMYKICVNTCLSRLKAADKFKTELYEEQDFRESGLDPSLQVVYTEEKDYLLSELEKLDKKSGIIVKMRLLYDKSFVEIGKMLNIPSSSARTNFGRSKVYLRKSIEDFRKERG